MKRIGRESETAFNVTRDRHGRTVRHDTAATALAHRDQAALQAYATYLLPYADELLAAARHTLDALPPARHTTAWQAQLDSLAASHTRIAKALAEPAEPGSAAERTQRRAVWPHFAFWADHSYLATELADPLQHREIPLTDAPAEPFIPIRHAITGEITTTGYNAAARRILLQSGFEETPGCACRATELGVERTHGPARLPASCSAGAASCPWAEPSAGR